MKKKINIIVVLICLTLLVILIVITFQAITNNENWSYSIDFEDSNKTISSYGSLIAGIVALLSAILLIYTIFSQIHQFKRQNKQFKKQILTQETQFQKQFKLQQEQFDEEKRRVEYDEKKDMFFKLKLVDVFLISIISHLKIMSIEMKNFFEFEKSSPLLNNILQFDVNKDTERLNKLDNLSLFKTFQHFFENETDNWVKGFNDLFSIVTFYNEMLKELFTNTKYHIKDKYERKLAISLEIKSTINYANNILVKYKSISADYIYLPYYKTIEDLVGNYNNYLKANEKERIETDFNEMSQRLFLPFIEKILNIQKEVGFDEYGTQDLINFISSIRKDIYALRMDSLNYAKIIENRYNEYFIEESEQLSKLKEVQNMIHAKLSKLNLNNL